MERDARIEAALPLANSIAKTYAIPGLSPDDLRQEAAVATCQAADSFDPDLGTWPDHAGTAVRNHLNNLQRNAKRQRRCAEFEPLPDDLPVSCDPSARICAEESRLLLRHAIDALPTRQRDVLDQRYFGSLTQRDVAARLGCSQQSVQRSESRAVLSLGALMGAA